MAAEWVQVSLRAWATDRCGDEVAKQVERALGVDPGGRYSASGNHHIGSSALVSLEA